jgi:hypothetical protein
MPDTPSYLGWLRERGGAWRVVCQGNTREETFARLILVPTVGAHVEREVLESGKEPRDRRKGRF